MYTPAHFAQTNPEVLHRILREHPLGTLVRTEEGALDAVPAGYHVAEMKTGLLVLKKDAPAGEKPAETEAAS